jgi:hypothetical protein
MVVAALKLVYAAGYPKEAFLRLRDLVHHEFFDTSDQARPPRPAGPASRLTGVLGRPS